MVAKSSSLTFHTKVIAFQNVSSVFQPVALVLAVGPGVLVKIHESNNYQWNNLIELTNFVITVVMSIIM